LRFLESFRGVYWEVYRWRSMSGFWGVFWGVFLDSVLASFLEFLEFWSFRGVFCEVLEGAFKRWILESFFV
jgi:hypothetical protein